MQQVVPTRAEVRAKELGDVGLVFDGKDPLRGRQSVRERTRTALIRHPSTLPRELCPVVLVIDNYDSFVYNLVQYLGELDADPIVHRHDAVTLDEIFALDPDAILISPGPGTPDDAGLSNEVIRAFAGQRPCSACASVTSAWARCSAARSCGRRR